ncbi:Zinc finger protein [Actinidia chinensis var. chinensis]|uniref:Zinc finger protein n=1 Tax=Actinidia chinensis var. chinensis TaxID=1590841 RepID=A0A2R6Q967_ACTCC|nr:Zinc finger protein [Actinidia chinensis var. chinensis]
MNAETELMFPYFQNFSQEVQQLEEFCRSRKPNVPIGNLFQTSTISEYDLGGEGDLFKAPEPIIDDSSVGFDPMAAAISMISCGEDVISPQALKVADIESIQSEQLMSEVFYECKKDILAKDAIETSLSDVMDIKFLVLGTDENFIVEDKLFTEGSFQKSVSSGCLSSMEWMHGAPVRPNFLDFPGMDLDDVYGMRRAFSESDIKTLGNGNVNFIHSPLGLPQPIGNCTTEDRWQKLSRYRNKKSKRNFGRKIKYACRKALADSQPRIRGRFAKTEESNTSKKQ